MKHHRIAAASILAAGIVIVATLAPTLAGDSVEVRAVREKLRGSWVASRVQVGADRKLEGEAASRCRAKFDGKSVEFRGLIGDIDANGTYYLENPGRVDFKLDAGWIVGVYELDGGTLTLCINPFTPPERLGVPTRPRPTKVQSAEGRHYYVFRKVAGNP